MREEPSFAGLCDGSVTAGRVALLELTPFRAFMMHRLRHLLHVVVYGGDERRRLGNGIELVPWRAVAEGDLDLPL